jgi:hypothetical protein
MARSIDVINQQILDTKALQTPLNGLTSTSKVSIWGVFIYIIAVCINLFEQLLDIFRIEMQGISDKVAPGSIRWMQAQIFKFQYSATTAQILQLNLTDFTIGYASVNAALQIITQCSVATDVNKNVNIKVAKSNGAIPPSPIALVAGTELLALTEYVKQKGFAGVQYTVISVSADLLYIQASVNMDGQYSLTGKINIIAALNNYMATLPFDGVIKASAIETAILNVTGVKDVVISSLSIRPAGASFIVGTALITASTVVNRSTATFSGYLAAENTTGNGFADTGNISIV